MRMLALAALVLVGTGLAASAAGPPNAPAQVAWQAEAGRLRLEYHGGTVLEATVQVESGGAVRLETREGGGEKVEQRLRFAPVEPRPGAAVVLRGTVTASAEAFPAETAGAPQRRFPLVRNSVGPSHNRRNHAVYDRRWDWVLVGPDDGATAITHQEAAGAARTFAWASRGPVVELVFRPRYYQKHRGLANFEPWTYRVWPGSVTGYCTWWAYRDRFSQKTLDEVADVFAAKKLPDFGYKYLQIDDAYQIGNGSCPRNWLTWNGKFPGGAAAALAKIKSVGLEGGIWVHRVHRPSDPHVAEIGKQHPDWFIRKPDGKLYMDQGFYVLDTRNQAALDGMARDLYRELRKQGWAYVKIDGAGDLLNAYRNRGCAEHFKQTGGSPEASLRDWDRVAREELGPGTYVLSCWGVGPGLNLIGLVDGCRLSDDGFQPETLARFSSYEGVVWRNDPDHCDILGAWLMDEQARMPVFGQGAPVPTRTVVRPALCSLAGGVLMLSDKAEVYRDDLNLEGIKRSAPVLPTVPGQLYDPGHGADTWWLQELARPFESWAILARVQWAKKREKEWKFDLQGAPAQEVTFADLGLDPQREYLVFEYWTQTYLGRARGSFTAPAMDQRNGLQVFAIRAARAHPWVVSTTRHLSQGAVDLLDERWDGARATLAGRSAVVAGDPYVLTVALPAGFRLLTAEADGHQPVMATAQGACSLRIVPTATGPVSWRLTFAHE